MRAKGVGHGHLDAGELGVKAGILNDPRHSQMIGVGVLEVGHEQNLRPVRADDSRHRVPRFDRVFDKSIAQTKLDAPNGLAFGKDSRIGRERLGRRYCFARPRLRVSIGCRLAIGHIQQQDGMPLFSKAGDGAAHAEFLVIRVRADDEYLSHGAIPLYALGDLPYSLCPITTSPTNALSPSMSVSSWAWVT